MYARHRQRVFGLQLVGMPTGTHSVANSESHPYGYRNRTISPPTMLSQSEQCPWEANRYLSDVSRSWWDVRSRAHRLLAQRSHDRSA
jgi:hypothetical protein